MASPIFLTITLLGCAIMYLEVCVVIFSFALSFYFVLSECFLVHILFGVS